MSKETILQETRVKKLGTVDRDMAAKIQDLLQETGLTKCNNCPQDKTGKINNFLQDKANKIQHEHFNNNKDFL